MDQVIITIITHKVRPNDYELISILQASRVLKKYKFAIVIPNNIEASYYITFFKELDLNYTIEQFDPLFFGTISRYNKFLLNKSFYQRFENYKYILIYHFDSFVFRDELEYWCNLDYDYIGAPFFKDYDTSNNKELWYVGNGGFSLRKTSSFLKLYDRKKIRLSPKKLFNLYYDTMSLTQKILHIPIFLLKCFSYKNNRNFYLNSCYQEDVFWSYVATNIKMPLQVIPINHAIKFSFDGNASTLFKINHNNLPFGCHAWFKYGEKNIKFWKEFIIREGYKIN